MKRLQIDDSFIIYLQYITIPPWFGSMHELVIVAIGSWRRSMEWLSQ